MVEDCDISVHPEGPFAEKEYNLYIGKAESGRPITEENELFRTARRKMYYDKQLSWRTCWVLLHTVIQEPHVLFVQLKVNNRQQKKMSVFFHPSFTAADEEGVDKLFPTHTGRCPGMSDFTAWHIKHLFQVVFKECIFADVSGKKEGRSQAAIKTAEPEEDVGQAIQELAQKLSELGRELQGVTARELSIAKKNQLLELGWSIMDVVEPGVVEKLHRLLKI